ncbi:MAG: hypothetical protein EKK60_06955 [Gordonia sp. (in: high G+C Gram-positive bacteria)]|nr:MAG: hypothetical protein EKK60_06955 [Gordonia sp. (in: high G+C Gram-positive bacteria)]
MIEWWGEHLGLIRYSAARQVPLTLLAAPAVGVGLARYLEHPGDRLFWGVVATYAVLCLVPFLIGPRLARDRTPPGDADPDLSSPGRLG